MVPLSEFRAIDCHAVCVHFYQIGKAKLRIEDFIIGTIHRILLWWFKWELANRCMYLTSLGNMINT